MPVSRLNRISVNYAPSTSSKFETTSLRTVFVPNQYDSPCAKYVCNPTAPLHSNSYTHSSSQSPEACQAEACDLQSCLGKNTYTPEKCDHHLKRLYLCCQ
ncbi:hypothetical protein BDN71DRAFT_1405484, partial [Pleurotus eryngii]